MIILHMLSHDTIAAIATPIGSAGIGVIRISGPASFQIAAKLFTGATSGFDSHRAYHGKLVDPSTQDEIDDVVLTAFKTPHSYTGENVVEISCHGSITVMKAALSAVLQSGARLADPGEFTKRAFLNGKLDLAQAEAVNDLIRSRTDGARKVALRQLDGELSKRVGEIDHRVLGIIAAVEAAIDFPDDVAEPESDWVCAEIKSCQDSISHLLASFGRGRIYREGLRVVIAGNVNVGKSSLLNALLRHARAIVTPIPGTTRDIIEESLEIDGIPIVAIDTAGLRSTEDEVEKIGVELSRKSIESADLLLHVLDASEDNTGSLSAPENQPMIIVVNKIDLVDDAKVEGVIKKYCGDSPIIPVSAVTGTGIDSLEREIARIASSGSSAESVIVSTARHAQLLESAAESLDHAIETLDSAAVIDLLSVDLTSAHRSLGGIIGETATDDLLERIFSEFCIGK